MRILWLSHFVPYPPAGGALQRSFHLLRSAAQKHEVHLLAQGDITLDSGLTPVATPDVPAAPGEATKVDADALAADVSVGGSVRLVGKLMSGMTVENILGPNALKLRNFNCA